MIKLKLLGVAIIFFACSNSQMNQKEELEYEIIGSDTILNVTMNSKLQGKYQINNGVKSGFYELYDTNGFVYESGFYEREKRIGTIKHYSNGSLKKVEYYAKDTPIYVFDKTDFILDTFKLEGYSISLPKAWETKTIIDSQIHAASHKLCKGGESYCPSIVITSEEIKVELKEFYSKIHEIVRQRFQNLKIEKEFEYNLRGHQVLQINYGGVLDAKEVETIIAIIELNGKVLIINGTNHNLNKKPLRVYDGLFQSIILSFDPRIQ